MTDIRKQNTHESLLVLPVSQDDCKALWQWRNDARTRAMSLNSDVVEYDAHCQWFDTVLNDPSQYIYMATLGCTSVGDERSKVGVVRFGVMQAQSTIGDVKSGSTGALISINMNPGFRGLGLSVPLLQACIETFCKTLTTKHTSNEHLSYLKAIIKPNNIASIKCFEALGFLKLLNTNTSDEEDVYLYQMR